MSAEERKQVAEDKKKERQFHVLDETRSGPAGRRALPARCARLFLYDEKKAELTPCAIRYFRWKPAPSSIRKSIIPAVRTRYAPS